MFVVRRVGVLMGLGWFGVRGVRRGFSASLPGRATDVRGVISWLG
jgi:hypothetical protein